jgi:TonB family protein
MQLAGHLQASEANVDAVEIRDHVDEKEEWHHAPGDMPDSPLRDSGVSNEVSHGSDDDIAAAQNRRYNMPMIRPIAAALALLCFAPALPAQEDAGIAADLRKAIADNVRKGGADAIKNLAEQCDKLPAPPKPCAEAWDWYGMALQTDRNEDTLLRSEILYRKALALIGDSGDDPAVVLALELESQAVTALGDDTRGKDLWSRAIDKRNRIVAALQPELANPAPDPAFHVGGSVSAPAVLSRIDPEYAEPARLLKYSGTVLLSIVVTAAGEPSAIHLIRPLGFGLDEQAVKAVQQWKFRPGVKEGQPVNVRAQIEVNFRLL